MKIKEHLSQVRLGQFFNRNKSLTIFQNLKGSFATVLYLGITLCLTFSLNAELRTPSSLVPKKLHETPKSYQNRQSQIEKFRDAAAYFLSCDQTPVTGPHFGSSYDPFKKFSKYKTPPSRQNCLNALGNLVAAANAGDNESAMILGEIYETGRLLGSHTIPVDQNWIIIDQTLHVFSIQSLVN